MRLGGGVAARRAEEIADLPVRLALGGTMLYHGLSKLRGEGPAQTSQMFESLGLTPGRPLAIATGVTEALAGAAAILGIGTRAAALAVLATQAVAIWKVHGPKGYSNMQGGMEYNLSIAAMSLGLLLTHPGVLSLHRAATRSRARARGVPGWLTRTQPGFADRALAMMH